MSPSHSSRPAISLYFPYFFLYFFSIPRDSGVIFGADGREWARVVCGSQ